VDIDIFYAIGVFVGSQAITIMWLKSDLKKHEANHTEYVRTHSDVTVEVKAQITELYERTNHIMRREEIEGVVQHELTPIQDSIDDLSSQMGNMEVTLVELAKQIAVMNALRHEQAKHQNRNHNERASD